MRTLIIALLLIASCSEPKTKQPEVKEPEITFQQKAQNSVVNFLYLNLNDSASYQPSKWTNVDTIFNEDGSIYVLGINHLFRSKNSFGGIVLDEYRFTLDTALNVLSSAKMTGQKMAKITRPY